MLPDGIRCGWFRQLPDRTEPNHKHPVSDLFDPPIEIRQLGAREGFVFAWGTRGPADAPVQWASQLHDPQNTGNFEVALPVQAGPPDSADDTDAGGKDEVGGCCDARGPGGRAAWVLAPLAVLALARRRSARVV